MSTKSVQFRLKRRTTAQWASPDTPNLANGEPGYEIGTGRLKIGNGISNWTQLPYVSNVRTDTAANWEVSPLILGDGEIGFDSTNGIIKIGNNSATFTTLPSLTDNTITTSYSVDKLKRGYSSIASQFDGTKTVHFFGDSFTAGIGAPTAAERYTNVLAARFGFTLVNNGASGHCMPECWLRIILNYIRGRTSSIMIGYNDTDITTTLYTLPQNYYLFKESLQASMLYLTLPSASFRSSRDGAVSTTGTWVNSGGTYSGASIGRYSFMNTGVATMTTTMTGRYVGFVICASDKVASFSYTVNGGTSIPIQHKAIGIAPSGGQAYMPIAIVFDTGVNGSSNTIVITTNSNFSSELTQIDFFFGFNNLSSGSTVLVNGISPKTYNNQSINANYVNGDINKSRLFEEMIRSTANFMRREYNAPIYYVDHSPLGNWGFANKTDMNHPDANGHRRIADRITSVINNGEYFYDK